MTPTVTLIKPDVNLENAYHDFMHEWETSGEALIPSSITLDASDFLRLVLTVNGFADGRGLPSGYVSQSTFWLIDGCGRILGVIDIRHSLTEYLAHRGGHIGYGIRPSERGKGYGVLMLRLALDECRRLGLTKLLITCSKSNKASAKTIIRNGGLLDSEDMDAGDVFQRYWITL